MKAQGAHKKVENHWTRPLIHMLVYKSCRQKQEKIKLHQSRHALGRGIQVRSPMTKALKVEKSQFNLRLISALIEPMQFIRLETTFINQIGRKCIRKVYFVSIHKALKELLRKLLICLTLEIHGTQLPDISYEIHFAELRIVNR